jgi:Cytochrome C'
MKKIAVLTMFLVCVWSLAAADEDEKQARTATAAVLKLAGIIEKGDEAAASKQATEMAGKFPLVALMNRMKLRRSGGLGFGEKPGSSLDGIEARVRVLARVSLSRAALEKQSTGLLRLAHVTGAIARVTEHHKSPAAPGQDPKDWKDYAARMKAASAELARAVKEKAPDRVRTAGQHLNNTCAGCHATFR